MPLQEQLDLRERVEVCETAVARLDAQFRQLRGYVYAKKGAVGPAGTLPPGEADLPATPAPPASTAAPAASATSKDELRRQLAQAGRFVPGKAPKHSPSEPGE